MNSYLLDTKHFHIRLFFLLAIAFTSSIGHSASQEEAMLLDEFELRSSLLNSNQTDNTNSVQQVNPNTYLDQARNGQLLPASNVLKNYFHHLKQGFLHHMVQTYLPVAMKVSVLMD